MHFSRLALCAFLLAPAAASSQTAAPASGQARTLNDLSGLQAICVALAQPDAAFNFNPLIPATRRSIEPALQRAVSELFGCWDESALQIETTAATRPAFERRPEPLSLRIRVCPRREHARGGRVVVALDHERRVCCRPVAHHGLLFDLVFFDCVGVADSSVACARNPPSRSSRASHVARRSLIQRSAVLSARGSISHVRTRPTLCERTTPPASST